MTSIGIVLPMVSNPIFSNRYTLCRRLPGGIYGCAGRDPQGHTCTSRGCNMTTSHCELYLSDLVCEAQIGCLTGVLTRGAYCVLMLIASGRASRIVGLVDLPGIE